MGLPLPWVCLFPQPSTQISLRRVTCDLDPQNKKLTPGDMRDGYLQQIGGQAKYMGFSLGEERAVESFRLSTNSFSTNILRASPCPSIFCSGQTTFRKRNSFEMNALHRATENHRMSRAVCKSLFWNILRVKPLESRFCEDKNRSHQRKPFEINILAGATKKTNTAPLDCPPPFAGSKKQRAALPAPHYFAAGTPPYFSNHSSSSRTLIFPCQGFLPRPWPSPGNTRSLFGIPSEYSACSSR